MCLKGKVDQKSPCAMHCICPDKFNHKFSAGRQCNVMAKSTDSELKSCLCHLPVVWLRASHFTSLPQFSYCRMEIITVPTMWGLSGWLHRSVRNLAHATALPVFVVTHSQLSIPRWWEDVVLLQEMPVALMLGQTIRMADSLTRCSKD